MITSESAKAKRERLFKKSRPLVRLYEQKDNGFLWAAYLKGSFDLPEGLSQAEFLPAVAEKWGGFPLVYVIEDENKGFKSGKGIIALVPVWTDGWVYEPTVKFFG